MMKTSTSSWEGYLTLRPSPSAPPPMVRRYCQLIGTKMYLFNSEEEAEQMIYLKGEVDVLGVQEWDGKGNVHIYVNAFLFATAQSKIFYAYADTPREKEMWMRAIQLVVATNTASGSIAMPNFERLNDMASPSSSASAIDFESAGSMNCAYCKDESNPIVARKTCFSCDRPICDKHATKEIPLPQCNAYNAKTVCDECFYSQVLLNFLKSIVERLVFGVCVYPKRLDRANPIELLTPSTTNVSNMAYQLFHSGAITAEELEALLIGDQRYVEHNDTIEPEIPLDLAILRLHRQFREENFTVCKAVILLHKNLDKDPMIVKPIIQKLYDFSHTDINEVEFYWPQLIHAYLKIQLHDFDKLFWMDELILSICERSIHLALLLMWQLQGALEDTFDLYAPKAITARYGRIVRLMIILEVNVVGRCLNDVFTNITKGDHIGLPIPTEEQVMLISDALYEWRQFQLGGTEGRRSSILKRPMLEPSCASDTKPVGMNATTSLKLALPADALRKEEPNATTEETANEEVKFSDFSSFQKHLLTPKDETPMFRDRTSSASIELEAIGEMSPEEDNIEEEEPGERHTGEPILPKGRMKSRSFSAVDKSVLAKYFSDEKKFVGSITEIAEKLRFVQPRSERKPRLDEELEKLELPDTVYIPLVKATDAFERIIRLPRGEAKAFSTKARVLVLLVFEVIRGGSAHEASPIHNHISRRLLIEADDEVGRILNKHRQEGFSTLAAASSSTDLEEFGGGESGALGTTTITMQAPPTPDGVLDGALPTPRFGEDSHPGNSTPPAVPTDSNRGPTIDLSSIEVSEETMQREEERKVELESAFGETWESKKRRLQESSPFGNLPGWDIVSMIGKSNDDLRQEVFAQQLIQKFKEIFHRAELPLWLKTYRIIGTSSSTGLMETLSDASSLDALKKQDGFVSLLSHFEKSYGPVDSNRFNEARQNFISSMAAYSLVTYFLQIRDRHNGNIMLSSSGHIIHIDFGFLLGLAVGGSFNIETAPFKLTAEMVDTMGGADSDFFQLYSTLCIRGFLACQQNCDEICDLVALMAEQSPYPCFSGKDTAYVIHKLRSRFKTELNKEQTIAYVIKLINWSHNSYSTRQYDTFQRMTNGILP